MIQSMFLILVEAGEHASASQEPGRILKLHVFVENNCAHTNPLQCPAQVAGDLKIHHFVVALLQRACFCFGRGQVWRLLPYLRWRHGPDVITWGTYIVKSVYIHKEYGTKIHVNVTK